MANVREISGNTIGNNVTIIQGDHNAAYTKRLLEKDKTIVENIKNFLSQIAQTDPFYDRKRILDIKGPFLRESFDWILDHKDFEKWRCARASGVLWIKGDPGKGKTMLLCGIINELEENPGINANLSYFFCQATDSRINTATSVIGALIIFFIKRVQNLLLRLLTEYEEKLGRSYEPLPITAEDENNVTQEYDDAATRPRELLESIHKNYGDKLNQLNGPNGWHILCDLFTDVTLSPAVADPICIVDALDECEHNSKSLLSLIVKTSGHIKWLISSRNVKDIERGLRLIEPAQRLGLELKGNAENVSKSVDAYINNSIQGIEALEDDEELQIKTLTTLKRKANGTFLWVALVVEQLRDTDHRNVDEVLEEIPEGLENLYDLIVKRANAKLRQRDREACQILLSIVTTAERPLRLEELHTFISSQWSHYKSSYNILDIKDVVRDCGSLLAIRDNTIYFIHQSVKDYIVGSAYNSMFPSGIQYQHQKMFEASISAMSRTLKYDIYNLKHLHGKMGYISSPHPDPLVPIAYSCVFWVEHLIRGYDSGGFKTEEYFKDDGLLQTFLKTKYLCWLEALALLRNLTPEGESALQRLYNHAAIYYKSKENRHQATHSQEEEETNGLMKLIGDAHRFFRYCQYFVKEWPLQLYYSAIIFEDKDSEIHKAYRQSVRAHFGGFIAPIKKPQRRHSLQRNIDISGPVAKLLHSPDASMLCVVSKHSDDIALYRTDTVGHAVQLNADDKHHHYVSFSPDSRHLISVSRIGNVQMWTIDSGSQVHQLSLNLDLRELYTEYDTDFQEEVIGLSPHGDLAASILCTSDQSHNKYLSSMKIWTTNIGTCVCEIDLMHIPSGRQCLLSMAFASDSALIALTHESDARIYSVWTGEMVKHIRNVGYLGRTEFVHSKFSHSKFSQDSTRLVLLRTSCDICFWCTESWTMIRRIQLGDCIEDFDLSLDASMFVAVLQKTLVFGSTTTGGHLLKIAIGYSIENVSFSSDWSTSSLLASATSDDVQIWRVDTRYSSGEMRNTACSKSSVAISPGSKYVAARSLEGHINIWCGNSGECIQTLKTGDYGWACPVFSPNLKFVAYAEGNQADVRIWHLTAGDSLHLLERHRGNCMIHAMVFSDDSKHLVTGYNNNEVRVWCTETGKCLFKSEEGNDDDNAIITVKALAISPKTKYVARVCARTSTSTQEDFYSLAWEVRIWDWRAYQDISSFCLKEPKRELYFRTYALHFSSDDTNLAVIWQSEGLNNIFSYEAQIWDFTTGTHITSLTLGESFSVPLFDPITNKILTDRASFYKRSSWDDWGKSSRQGFSLWQPEPDRSWICFSEKKVSLIPREFSPIDLSRNPVAVSSSLLAYTTSTNEIMIIRLSNQNELQRLEIIILNSDIVGDYSMRIDDRDSEFTRNLAEVKFDPDEPIAKRLKLSYLSE